MKRVHAFVSTGRSSRGRIASAVLGALLLVLALTSGSTVQAGDSRDPAPAAGAPHALSAETWVDALIGHVSATVTHHGTRQSLLAKLDAARADLRAGRSGAASGVLGALANEISAQRGKKIGAHDADVLQLSLQRLQWFREDGVVPPPVISPASESPVTAFVGAEAGGSLELRRADGVRYALEFPPGALFEDAQIALVPVGSVAGLPFASAPLAMVRMQPQGIRFRKPITLSIDLPADPPTDLAGFLCNDDGTELHTLPIRVTGRRVVFELRHFTDAGVVAADYDELVLLIEAEFRALSAEQAAQASLGLWVEQFDDVQWRYRNGEITEAQRDADVRALIPILMQIGAEWYYGRDGIDETIRAAYADPGPAFMDPRDAARFLPVTNFDLAVCDYWDWAATMMEPLFQVSGASDAPLPFGVWCGDEVAEYCTSLGELIEATARRFHVIIRNRVMSENARFSPGNLLPDREALSWIAKADMLSSGHYDPAGAHFFGGTFDIGLLKLLKHNGIQKFELRSHDEDGKVRPEPVTVDMGESIEIRAVALDGRGEEIKGWFDENWLEWRRYSEKPEWTADPSDLVTLDVVEHVGTLEGVATGPVKVRADAFAAGVSFGCQFDDTIDVRFYASPIVDGVMSPGEWDDAVQIDAPSQVIAWSYPSGYLDLQRLHSVVRIYVTNDAHNLYMAARIDGAGADAWLYEAVVGAWFARSVPPLEESYGVHYRTYDDGVRTFWDSRYGGRIATLDYWGRGVLDVNHGGTVNGEFSHSVEVEGGVTFELSRPLSAVDPTLDLDLHGTIAIAPHFYYQQWTPLGWGVETSVNRLFEAAPYCFTYTTR